MSDVLMSQVLSSCRIKKKQNHSTKIMCLVQHDGQPYCHKPCYAVLFGPKGKEYTLIHHTHRFFPCLISPLSTDQSELVISQV